MISGEIFAFNYEVGGSYHKIYQIGFLVMNPLPPNLFNSLTSIQTQLKPWKCLCIWMKVKFWRPQYWLVACCPRPVYTSMASFIQNCTAVLKPPDHFCEASSVILQAQHWRLHCYLRMVFVSLMQYCVNQHMTSSPGIFQAYISILCASQANNGQWWQQGNIIAQGQEWTINLSCETSPSLFWE